MKILPPALLGAATAVLALSVLTGCSGDEGTTAKDDTKASTDTSTEPTEVPTVGTYPELDAQDYTYLLQQQCFCPITGPVLVTVEDGKATSAVITKGGNGMKKGSDAPTYLLITINDVIAQANNTDAAKVDVDWPDGQDWPSSVAVDRAENATDDEVTYLISDVEVSS
jgi:hypothetical protein